MINKKQNNTIRWKTLDKKFFLHTQNSQSQTILNSQFFTSPPLIEKFMFLKCKMIVMTCFMFSSCLFATTTTTSESKYFQSSMIISFHMFSSMIHLYRSLYSSSFAVLFAENTASSQQKIIEKKKMNREREKHHSCIK